MNWQYVNLSSPWCVLCTHENRQRNIIFLRKITRLVCSVFSFIQNHVAIFARCASVQSSVHKNQVKQKRKQCANWYIHSDIRGVLSSSTVLCTVAHWQNMRDATKHFCTYRALWFQHIHSFYVWLDFCYYCQFSS